MATREPRPEKKKHERNRDPEHALALARLLFEAPDEGAVLRRLTAALAVPGGAGFCRAYLLVADAEKGVLAGRAALGAVDREEAERAIPLSPEELFEELRRLSADDLESQAPELTARVRSVAVPLDPEHDPIVAAAANGEITWLRSGERVPAVWRERLALGEFAAAPVRAFGRLVAIVLVERAFDARRIDGTALERLRAYAELAGSAIERVRLAARLEGRIAAFERARIAD
jgi:GAF domain-containing protein